MTIWWFSHDGTGIHGNIVCDGRFFDGVGDKASHLLAELARHTNTLSPDAPAAVAKISKAYPAFGKQRLQPAEPAGERGVCTVLRIPEGFHLNNKTYLDRLAIWQLSGADDQAALDGVLGAHGDGKAFWDPRFSPDRCAERIKSPKPLLVIGPKPLGEFGSEERRANYLDSSIWCRYASSEQEAADIRGQFARYRELGLYECNNGLEYLEFRARVLINARFGEFDSSGHRKISPIVFHSEGNMAEMTAADVQSFKDAFTNRPSLNRPLVWKVLLVDDHSREHLSGGRCSKLEVICDVLSPVFSIDGFDGGHYVPYPSRTRPTLEGLCRVRMHCATTIEEAMALIKEQHFDIILLDYLLNKEEKTAAPDRDFDTSDKLLERIKDAVGESERGPMGYLWMFNVSAFASAIEGKLAAKGFQYHTSEWHLSRGACPINTPELFKYNLFSFMSWQVDELTRFHQKQWPDEDKGGMPLIELLGRIFDPGEKTPRQRADEYFRSILNFEAACKVMIKDIRYGLSDKEAEDAETLRANPKKSEIVFSLFPDIIHYNKAFWDHLSHLIHSTAYGTPQQWPQMLIHFREIRKNLINANQERNEQAAEDVVKRIEEYIIDLNGRK